MEREEILKEFVKWQAQDRKNRVILIVASERVESEGCFKSSQSLVGSSINIIQALKNAIENDIGLAIYLRSAIAELVMEQALEKLSDSVG